MFPSACPSGSICGIPTQVPFEGQLQRVGHLLEMGAAGSVFLKHADQVLGPG